MPLRELLGEFELDPESIYVDRDVSMSLARAHGRQAEVTPEGSARATRLLAGATEFRRAAAHSVLLSDWELGHEMFHNAGMVYRSLGIPYALMMFACSRDVEYLAGQLGAFERSPAERTQQAYLLLAAAACGRELNPRIRIELTSASASPIGILGIPVGTYVDLAPALERDGDGESSIEAAVLPFLVAYSSAVRKTIGNSLHWGMLALPFHPAEPDILSAMFCAEAVLRKRHGRTLLDLLRTVPLFPVAANILYNAIPERFGDRH